jgi:hypothetical protein
MYGVGQSSPRVVEQGEYKMAVGKEPFMSIKLGHKVPLCHPPTALMSELCEYFEQKIRI